MAEEMPPEWRNYFFLGLVLLLNTIFIKISFSWPWDSESFTLGVMGLIGLTMLYFAPSIVTIVPQLLGGN